MKKMTKLLSVILAFVMALSCMTMMASAAKTSYQTVSDLEGLQAYSPYGTVTRLTTEERLSIVCDSLDKLLAKANINMGTINVVLAKITLDFTSLNQVLVSLDSFFGAKHLLGIVGGTIKKLDLNSWRKGMSRETTAHTVIINEILELLSTNTSAIGSIFDEGLNLGLVTGFIKGLNLGPINNAVKDLPGLVKAIVLPLMGRQDDDQTQRDKLGNRSSDLMTVAQDFVNGLFTNKMAWTSYRVNEAGADLGYTDALPTEASGTSRYFVKNANGTITQFDYAYAGALGGKAGYNETVTYTLSEEEEYKGSGTYLYKAPEGYTGDATLKWYKAENIADANGDIQSGYWLPSVRDAIKNGKLTIEINGADSVLGLVYKFIPYLFAEMAPTVLNGSVKQVLAKALGVEFNYIGKKGSAELAEAIKGVSGGDFFTKAQDFYVWEYSDYKVINDVPYYRFQDDYYRGELPKDLTAYYYMFNWDWNIGGDFFNEFIPTTVGSTWVLDNFGAIVQKAIDTVLVDNWTVKGEDYKISEIFAFTDRNGDGAVNNADLLENIMAIARTIINIAPEEIFDDYYKEAQFFDAMMNGTLKQAVNGVVCELVKLIMPQIKFSDDIINQPLTAIAAIVVRELCTQLMPTYNFDAMIYANYGKEGAPTRSLINHTADEWLDITLYMGVNLGLYYLRNIADVGEDSESGYFAVMANLGAIPANTPDAMTFGANAYKAKDGQASWLVAVDWIVDWALDVNTEWCWHFGRLVNVDGEINLATYQNPLNKINSVITTFIPELNNLLNLSAFSGTDYGSGTLVEKVLKDGLVDSIVNLDLTSLLNMFKIPEASALRKTKIADTVVQLLVTFLNEVLKKVVGGGNFINTSTINSINTLLNQANLKTVVVNLIGKLYAASNTYYVLDPILPIANFFLGWTTDPQKYAEPDIYFTNNGNDSFFMANAGATMKVVNESSGMLLKHRNVSTEDKAYVVTVKSIAFDNSNVSATGFPAAIGPSETKDFAITIPANTAEVVKATITYTVTGKDGNAIGGDQTKISYLYVSNIDDDEGIAGANAGVDANFVELNSYNKYVFTKDIYNTVTNYTATVTGKGDNVAKVDAMQFVSLTTNTAPSGKAATYFAHLATSEASSLGGWDTTQNNTSTALTGKLFKAKADVTADNFLPEVSEEQGLYGEYNMGKITLKSRSKISGSILVWNNGWKDSNNNMGVEVSFIYYNDFDINNVKSKYVGYNITADGYDATAYNTYEAALKEVVRLADYPFKIDYVTTIQPQIENAIKALETAYKNLMGSTSSTGSDISAVESMLATVETNPDRELNFQDYALFEYFQYEKQRNAAWNMISSVKGPEAPEKYIENGVWGNDIVDAIIAAQTNANVKAGINATVVPTSDPERKDEMDNYAKALADFKPATYSDLEIDNLAANLKYYADFMKANTKTISTYFLDNEIAYAEAQNYNQADYSADSWARYTEALANAKAAQSSNKESLIFDAKYELMVAQNKLEKHSMKESGYLEEELIPLIKHADAIINNYGTLYSVKDGVAYADAFAQLVTALGVRYEVEIDGKTQEGILYDRSALTFTDYDRNDTSKNKRAVDAAADKLRAAIENFECTVKLESKDDTVATVDQSIRYIQGINPNSIPTADVLLGKLNVVGTATPVVQVSKAGNYGTGARVELKSGDTLLATYFVVIYGDVNGDGAVDAFDAIEVDVSNHTNYYMGDVYDDAADIDHNGIVNAEDYAAIKTSVKCAGTISQSL